MKMIKNTKSIKKRILFFLCAISLMFSFSACGTKDVEVTSSIPDYSDVSVELYESDTPVHSNDAKFKV